MADNNDFSLPQNVINKVLSDVLPPNVTIEKEAKSALGKCASIFIVYCTNMAAKAAQQAERTTLSAQDVVDGVTVAGFEDLAPQLKEVYQMNRKQREVKNEKRRERERQKKLEKSKSQPQEEEEDEDDNEEEEEESD